MQAFLKQVRQGRLELYEQSSHFPRFERYAEVVSSFVTEHTSRR